MAMAFLGFLAFSRTTVVMPDIGGTYTEGIAGTPHFINPLLAQYNQVDQDLCALIFNGLTRADGTGGLMPDLAESWSVSDDGLAYFFKLRQDIRWQDGKRFTADDVLFTISLMQDPEFPGVPYLSELWQSVTVQKVDEYTVHFLLSEPYPAFSDFTTIGILPAHLLHDMPARDLLNHPFNLKPVGTGLFQLEEVHAHHAALSVNPYYTGPRPYLTRLEFYFYPTYQNMLAAYEVGETQGISVIPPQAMLQAQNIPGLNLYTARLSGYQIIYLNHQAPFFQEADVRRALLLALDRQGMIDQALAGQGVVAQGPILPWSWAYNPNQLPTNFDPQRAASLLNQTGWIDRDGDDVRDRDGLPLAFELLSGDDPSRVQVAQMAAEQWRQVGISTTVTVVGAGLGQRLAQHDFQAALAQVVLSGDPDPYPLWHQTQIEGGQNYAGWSHRNASILLEAGRSVSERGPRSDYYYEFQRIFAEEMPSLILFYPVYTYGVNDKILGVQLAPMTGPSDRFRSLPHWYVLTRRIIFSEAQYKEVEYDGTPPPKPD